MNILKYVKNPKKIIIAVLSKVGGRLSDKTYLEVMYYLHFGKKLNLDDPKTFNQKIQWLKLYDRNPVYTNLADKFEVKSFVQEKIGRRYVVPTYGCWDSFDEIDFENLPQQFVLKCTHDSGGLVICKDKQNLDLNYARDKINKSLKRKFYLYGREMVYKDIKPRIIAEKYLVDESGKELKDYKFFCINGEPKLMYVASDRMIETKFDFFDISTFKHIPVKNGHEMAGKKNIAKPKFYDDMIKLASELSENIPFVRVDFYECHDGIYFGEMTFYHMCGFEPFEPEEYDYKFGQLIDLSLVNNSVFK
ncbi:ATP-grasp fold amidoligase family protein [Bacillus sp. AFS088145]|uniref:ATP-grasp fold amidoligase family protein n=1 Tax=Bacillus sp. AFS088145 TaxID=2033514 RepID=UPI000BF598E5|nr:ATP-grasp fold amidoligase family protein [Bacillus sp. AFS088145]PFH87078.1 glycosyl transferase [Bacillus sp. AFS088145]